MNSWQLSPTETEALLNFLQRLVQTPSLPGQEGAVAALVQAEMQRLGFAGVNMDSAGNVSGRVGNDSGPTLLLNTHMDTVTVAEPGRWKVDPWSAEVQQGRLYGLGSCDMKGGLAAAVYGAAHLLRIGAPLAGQVVVATVGLEEPAEGVGTRAFLEESG
ncbi:MAG TPA: M20/M25/M40 family metallo-hydrolase, partial [Anaerolineae bacterium]|nr:M20/M25/M40 family metallo-hydrolase [Anaerolineae bacterium]